MKNLLCIVMCLFSFSLHVHAMKESPSSKELAGYYKNKNSRVVASSPTSVSFLHVFCPVFKSRKECPTPDLSPKCHITPPLNTPPASPREGKLHPTPPVSPIDKR